jgi:hypothetical protein
LAHWGDAKLAHWVVYDINLHDLSRLADLVEQIAPADFTHQGIKPSPRESPLAKGAFS